MIIDCFTYRNSLVYKKSLELCREIYKVLEELPQSEQNCVYDQLQRAVSSITANFAEGSSRTSNKEKANFYSICIGSTSEVQAFIDICLIKKYISQEVYRVIDKLAEEIKRLLIKYINDIKLEECKK